MEQKWQGYIAEVLTSKKPYEESKRTVLVAGEALSEKTVHTEDLEVKWLEDKDGEILHVARNIR